MKNILGYVLEYIALSIVAATSACLTSPDLDLIQRDLHLTCLDEHHGSLVWERVLAAYSSTMRTYCNNNNIA